MVTNLDPDGQRTALRGARRARKGAVVAIEPRDRQGARDGLACPSYDPNRDPRGRFAQLNTRPEQAAAQPRRRRSGYPPGSTFKVVTATAAIDSGTVTPDIDHRRRLAADHQRRAARELRRRGLRADHLTDALTNSVNTVFAPDRREGRPLDAGGVHGALRLRRGSEARLPRRRDDRRAASATATASCVGADDGFDVGRVAIGQGGAEGEIRATPLQMAMVAATVANGGRLMKPRLTDRVVRKDGRVKERIEPDEQSHGDEARAPPQRSPR